MARFLDAYCVRVARLLGLELRRGERLPLDRNGRATDEARSRRRDESRRQASRRPLRTTLEMIRFSHTLFALPFALLAAVLAAGGWPRRRDARKDPPRDGRRPQRRDGAQPAGRPGDRRREPAHRVARAARRRRSRSASSARFLVVSVALFLARGGEPQPLDAPPLAGRARAPLPLLLHEAVHVALAPRPRPVPRDRAGRRVDRGPRRHRAACRSSSASPSSSGRPASTSSMRCRTRSTTAASASTRFRRASVPAGARDLGPLPRRDDRPPRRGLAAVGRRLALRRRNRRDRRGARLPARDRAARRPLARRRGVLHGQRIRVRRRWPRAESRTSSTQFAVRIRADADPLRRRRHAAPRRGRRARSASARRRSCELLARRFHGTKILEDVDNPFLPDFYKKKKGAAFQTQLFFLLSRYQQQREIAQIDLFTTLVVADYHFPKDKIFACLNLDDSELLIYDRLYTLLSETVRKPDLVIYPAGIARDLHEADQEGVARDREGDHAGVRRAADRGLQLLLLPLRRDAAPRRDTNEIDFVNRPADFDDLVAQIQKAKQGRAVLRPAGRASALTRAVQVHGPKARRGRVPATSEPWTLDSGPGRRGLTSRAIICPSPFSAAIPIIGTSTERKGARHGQPLGNLSRHCSPVLVAAKGREPIAMLTAYDAPTAALLDRRGARRPARRRLRRDDGLRRAEHALGDDGLDGPARARPSRGAAKRALVVGDMPFLSYQTSASARGRERRAIPAEAGCAAVKVEGGRRDPRRPSRRSSPPTSRSWDTSA